MRTLLVCLLLASSTVLAQETVSSPVQQQLVLQVRLRLGELEISNMQLQDQLDEAQSKISDLQSQLAGEKARRGE